MRNTNSLIGRYPGADGMKTGFICASGFNLVATATRNNKKLIAVVLGSPSSAVRGAKTASLFERGFTGSKGLSWLTPSLGTVDKLTPVNAAPPDMREEMCGKHRKRPAAEDADDDTEVSSNTSGEPGSAQGFMLSSLPPSTVKPSSLLAPAGGAVKAIIVYAGAARKSAEAAIATAKAKLGPKDAKTVEAATIKTGKPAGTNAAVAAKPQAPATTASTATTAAQPQNASAQPGAFAPPVGQFSPPGRGMPAVGESGNPNYMSFAPAAGTSPAPLTSVPPAAAPQAAAPAKAAAKPAAAPKTESAKTDASKTEAAPAPKPKPKAQAKPQPKPVATAPTAATSTAR
jgi:D-alanyl-D-alanine carboxypeptidase